MKSKFEDMTEEVMPELAVGGHKAAFNEEEIATWAKSR